MTSSSGSDQDSCLTPFSPSVRYHLDSGTLFGDVDPRSLPRRSHHMKGERVAGRPPRPPASVARQETLSTSSTASVKQARAGHLQLKPGQLYPGKGNVWPRIQLPLHGPTPKRDDLNASFRNTLSTFSEETGCTSPDSSPPIGPFLFTPTTRSTIRTGRHEVLKSLSPSTDTLDLAPFPPVVTSPAVPSFLIPQQTTLSVAGRNGGQHPLKKLSPEGFFFSDKTMQTPPTPSPDTSVKRVYWDNEGTIHPRKRISVRSASELEDSSSLWSTSQSSSSLNRGRQSSRHSSCCSTGPDSPPSEPVYRICSSTPKISTVPYALKSVTPIPKDPDQSQRFYEKGSPSLYFDSQYSLDTFTDSSLFSVDEAEKTLYTTSNFDMSSYSSASEGSPRRHSVSSYVQSPPKDFSKPSPRRRFTSVPDFDTPPSEMRRRRAEIEYDYGKLLEPFPRRPPKGKVDSVESLTCCTFKNFIKEQAVAVVMFYNSNTGKPNARDIFSRHTLKIPRNTTPSFASVDCATESQLCANEGVCSHPFYKLYVDGYLVSAVKDFGLLNYS